MRRWSSFAVSWPCWKLPVGCGWAAVPGWDLTWSHELAGARDPNRSPADSFAVDAAGCFAGAGTDRSGVAIVGTAGRAAQRDMPPGCGQRGDPQLERARPAGTVFAVGGGRAGRQS